MDLPDGRLAESEDAVGATVPTELVRWSEVHSGPTESDLLAREEPLEIRVHGRCIAVTMRTPGHDAELAAGFLLSEGLVRSKEDILEIAHCRLADPAREENIISVFLSPAVPVDYEKLSRHVFASSSCGLCGKTSIDAVHQQFAPVSSDMNIPGRTLLQLPERIRSAQKTFAQTGGLHAAAVFDSAGELMVVREDVGRHNAVDKVIGFGLLEGRLPLDTHILLVSGRASFEIVQKALSARIPVIAAVSAPSSLAVEFARENGQTLVGFVRGSSMNIYSGAHRVLGSDGEA